MANINLTPQMLTKEALMVIKNNLVFSRKVNRQYSAKYAERGWGQKTGPTIDIKRPPRYVGSTNTALTVEDHVQTKIPLTINTRFQVAVDFTSYEKTLSKMDILEASEIIKPAMATIANKVDRDGLLMAYRSVYNNVGTPGTIPSTLRTYLLANAKLDDEGAPVDDERCNILSPAAQVEIVDSLKGLFQSSTQIKEQYEKGRMGTAAGLDWSMSQNIITHTVGPLGGTPLVNGTQAGLTTGWAETGTLVTDGWTAAAALRLNIGDTFTIAGVFAVNPQSRQSTGQLRDFVVLANTSSDGAGNATISIAPAIISAGQFQNVSAAAADNAAIVVKGAANTVSPQGIVFHKDAFTLASVDLYVPENVYAAKFADADVGLSVRLIKDWQIAGDNEPMRFDVLYQWRALYPEWACRVQG